MVTNVSLYPFIPLRLEHSYVCSSPVLFITEGCIWLVILTLVVVAWLVLDFVLVSPVVAVVLGLSRLLPRRFLVLHHVISHVPCLLKNNRSNS